MKQKPKFVGTTKKKVSEIFDYFKTAKAVSDALKSNITPIYVSSLRKIGYSYAIFLTPLIPQEAREKPHEYVAYILPVSEDVFLVKLQKFEQQRAPQSQQ